MSKVITGNVAGIDFEAPLVLSDAHLRKVIDDLETCPRVAFDLETTGYEGQRDYGPDCGQIRLAQIAWREHDQLRAVVIDGQAADLSLLAPLLESDTAKLIHYSPFERSWIRHHLGLEINGVIDTCYLGQSINKALRGRVADLISQDSEDRKALQRDLFKLADSYSLPSGAEVSIIEVKAAFDEAEIPLEGWKLGERATLADMAKRYLGREIDKAGQTSDWSGSLTDEQLIYAAGDALVTLEIFPQVKAIADQLEVYGNMVRRVGYDSERR